MSATQNVAEERQKTICEFVLKSLTFHYLVLYFNGILFVAVEFLAGHIARSVFGYWHVNVCLSIRLFVCPVHCV